MYSEDELLPISGLQHLIFCERRAMLVLLEGIWEENLFTIDGRHLHECSDEASAETRGNMRIARGLRIRSYTLGLAGKADVVEFHRLDNKDEQRGILLEGLQGSWRPYPVEYKRGHLRREKGYEIQLCAQALCLEEMLSVDIPAGVVFYGKPRRRLDVAFNGVLRMKTVAAAARLHELTRSGKTPPPEYDRKCRNCSLLDCCMPRIAGKNKKVKSYMADAFLDIPGTEEER